MLCAENCNLNICQRVCFCPACRSLLLLTVSQWMVPAFPVLSRAVRTWLTDTRHIRRGSRPHQETPLSFLMATDSLSLVVNLLTAPLCFSFPCLSFGNNGLNPHLRELKIKKNLPAEEKMKFASLTDASFSSYLFLLLMVRIDE